MAITIKYGDVVDQYLQVVPGAASLADAYMDAITTSITGQQLAVNLSHDTATSGLFGGLRGNKRPVLLAEPTDAALRDFTMYLYGVPNGVNLAVGWYLAEAGRGGKNFAKGLASVHAIGAAIGATAHMSDVLRNISMFDMADLQSIITAIHQFSVMEAVYIVASKVGFDKARIGGRSSGLFGIG